MDTKITDAPEDLRPEIIQTAQTVNLLLGQIGVSKKVACSALMSLTAYIAAESLATDDQIIESFKACPLDARTRGQKAN